MLRRALAPLTAAAILCCAGLAGAAALVILPSGWRLSPPAGPLAHTGTMPQGIALSPDGAMLAVLESGDQPAALRILQTPGLRVRSVIPLKGAFGKPVWAGNRYVLVAGANLDAVLTIDLHDPQAARAIPTGKGTWPAAVAYEANAGAAGRIAAVNDGAATASIDGKSVHVGDHPDDAVFSRDGKTLYVSVRGTSEVAVIDVASGTERTSIPVGLHPAALALSDDGSTLYVAESDDDAVGVIDTRTNKKITDIPVRMNAPRENGYGASPNALAVRGNELFVSLGAENAVALIRNNRLVERIPAGWYPTGVAVGGDGTLYVSNGKGERAPANPNLDTFNPHAHDFVADITTGSVRAIPRSVYEHANAQTSSVIADAAPQWTPAPVNATILRPGGPIKHVIYIIKENRSYDQMLGDLRGANGDPKLVTFGAAITPNQHALARRFGIFDNAYTNAQISPDGHNWTDAALANDYVERFWPPGNGHRRALYDMENSTAPTVPHNGYIWDAAKRARITYRDYGEHLFVPLNGPITVPLNTAAGLSGHFDEHYVGWDPAYSDSSRYAEWLREFKAFANAGDLPQLEIVYLPDDHTFGTRPGIRTPYACIETNDWAVGRLVDQVSHSRYWKSTVIFILEDDAQYGPDHVSDQRSTFYIASPYARGGVQHARYSTESVVHSIELLLGLRPLSIYDETARPMYDAFATHAVNAAPFNAVRPRGNLNAMNTKAAYGAAISAKLDFTRPDAADARVMNDILAHARPR
ncbi:MAG TPA: beta-propeller fold lactonase family protein [Candidatus Baltobacteraceae bacterium]|nr:beta-propeller fold lactonase family protein [Candidatus Baltobacteraceae bacterium]